MSARRWTRITLSTAAIAAVLSGCAGNRVVSSASGFAVGINAKGEECSASPNWTDSIYEGSKVNPIKAYSVNCLGNTSAAVARVRIFDSAAARAAFSQATLVYPDDIAEQGVAFPGFADARARRSFDRALAARAIVIETESNGSYYQISAAENALAASHQALRIIAGLDTPAEARSDTNPFAPSDITALPPDFDEAEERLATGETLDTILSRGTALNFRGLHADASRFLRSELANLPADAKLATVVALQLEAALAESNTQFFGAADDYFSRVETGLQRLAGAEEVAALRAKQRTYLALDALNRNDFDGALARLNSGGANTAEASNDPARELEDINNLLVLNAGLGDDDRSNPQEADARTSLAIPQEQQYRDAFLGILEDWIRSVAELSRDNADPAAAGVAIREAENGLLALEKSLDQSRIGRKGLLWLRARVLRQRGRVEADSNRYSDAIASFDRAIIALRDAALARSGTGREPAIAELQLERASVIARSGAGSQATTLAYETAVAALLEARDDTTAIATELLQPYLDQLASATQSSDPAIANDAAAKYFLALQIESETGAARQMSALKEIVSQEAGVGAKLRQLAELSKRRSQIDLDIAQADETGLSDSRIAALRAEQADLLEQYRALDAELQGVARYNQVSSSPATLAELQDTLGADEAYVRFSTMGSRVFGVLVEKDRLRAIRPEGTADELLLAKNRIRSRIDARAREYDVTFAYLLYRQLLQPVDGVIRTKSELVVDGGEVLSGLNPAALVSDEASVRRWLGQADRADHSGVQFLATVVPTSIAMSPRSFVNSRKLAASTASRDLIGFASPRPLDAARNPDGQLRIGNCLITAEQARQLDQALPPIARTEILRAYEELNIGGSPSVVADGAFSDVAVGNLGNSNGELSDYKIVHFATHGLSEGQLAQFGCASSPAALLTSRGPNDNSDLLLDIEEIAQLRLKANLVVLSACRTASAISEETARRSGETQVGSTLEGMVRAFFAAEARAVLATYWEAPNKGETVAFMGEFYEAGRDRSISGALNAAQRSLIRNPATSNPLRWGAFFVVGDTDNNMLETAAALQVAAR